MWMWMGKRKWSIGSELGDLVWIENVFEIDMISRENQKQKCQLTSAIFIN